ncbi:hypothetical protein [Arsenicibacter rosenii]|uniref:Uncharacterized protein n=1 Tax=Arsenicibacter rosenii TaxID=1750698 RepID=A0A1S2VQZ2_9BACT|nr:hypothetical protein [Arsenicibacter rosenii]OIN60586.1 hypothetical protein BLX24_00205 [Arsenicibacter rosenii]
MRLNNDVLYEFLKRKEIHYLYHANTVSTSITYLEQYGLLSRGAVEELGLFQTEQSSDKIDRDFDIWYDIFLDTIDLHGYFPRQNLYGPIVFKFSVDLVLNPDYEIWITKDNPIYWTSRNSNDEKYFIDVEELSQKWDVIQRQRMMITIRNNKTAILFDYLNKIIVDNPKVEITDGNINLFNEAISAIRKSIKNNPHLHDKLTVRECNNCYCHDNYLNGVGVADLKRLFLPKYLIDN